MTATEFKNKVARYRIELMSQHDAQGIPLYSVCPDIKVVLHYETWRDILATCNTYDFCVRDRFFGCSIEQTTSVPVGEVRISRG